MNDRELMQHALEVLEQVAGAMPFPVALQVRAALRERLAQPEQEHIIDCPRCGHCCPQQPVQEPVAWMDREGDIYPMPEKPGWAPPHTLLYAAPPRREWVSLTDEERLDFFDDYLARTPDGRHLFRHSWSYAEEEREAFDAGVAAAEAALKEKNT